MVPPEPSPSPAGRPLRVATVSLAGCFGCHMSLLDIDERLISGLIEAAQRVDEVLRAAGA